MIRKIKSLSSSLPTKCLFRFAKQKRAKIQTIGFAKTHIQNLKVLSYKLKQPIKYVDGKYLVYKSKPSYLRTLGDYFVFIAAIIGLSYCLYNHVYFVVYPIAKHVYIAGLAIAVVLMAKRFLRNHSIVKEVYLLQGGKATELIFQNQFKRKLFGQPVSTTLYNSIFVSSTQKTKLFTNLYDFPQQPKGIQLGAQGAIFYWKKYYSNDSNLLMIPTNFSFMNEEAMINIMKGKIIIF